MGADQTLHTGAAGNAGPQLKVKLAKLHLGALVRSGKYTVKVSTNEASKVRLTLSTRIKHTVVLGASRTVTFRSNGTKSVTILLSKKGKSTLRHLRRAKLTITERATDLAGTTRITKVSTTLTR